MISDDHKIALLLERGGRDAQAQLTPFLASSAIAPLCYSYKMRFKPWEKLLEKKQRKIEKKPEYRLESITDVIGLRLVTLYRRDMVDALHTIVRAIKHIDAPIPNPFQKDVIEEIIIYTTNPFDKYIPIIKDNLMKEGFECSVTHSDKGYSSIHLIARIACQVKELPLYFIPIEIQIRTVFEDAWGEIDHKNEYVYRTGKESDDSSHNKKDVSSHLKILKKFTDACAEYADLIYEEANPSILKSKSPDKIDPVASDEDIIERFKSLHIDEKIIAQYDEARKARTDATKLFDTERGNGIIELMRAAELFRKILGDDESICQGDKHYYGKYLLRYYVKMNEGLCLLTTNSIDNIRKAYNIYLVLGEQYKEFPVLIVRLAQTLLKMGYLDQALEKYNEARELIRTLMEHKSKEGWSDKLPKTDYEFLLISVPKLLGYTYWMKSTEVDDNDDKLELLEKAYKITEEMVHLKLDELNSRIMHNNLLYYAVEYVQKLSMKNNDFSEKLRLENIPNHLKELESSEDATFTDIEVLDTLAKAYYFVGRYDDMNKICDKILNLTLVQENQEFDDDLKFEIARNAYDLKSREKN